MLRSCGVGCALARQATSDNHSNGVVHCHLLPEAELSSDRRYLPCMTWGSADARADFLHPETPNLAQSKVDGLLALDDLESGRI